MQKHPEQQEKRNARERQRIERKAQTVKQMRTAVIQLEFQRDQVVAALEADQQPNASQQQRSLQRQCMRAMYQSERLRAQNRALRGELERRELVSLTIEDVIDQAGGSNDDDKLVEQLDCAPIHLSSRDVHLLADALCQQLSDVYQRCSFLPEVAGMNMFGWRDLRCFVDDRIEYAMKKTFRLETAAHLMRKTWQLFTSARSLQQIAPSMVPIRPVFRFYSESIAVAWLGMRETTLPSPVLVPTDWMLCVQVQPSDSKFVLLFGGFSSLTYAHKLAMNQPIEHPCYWTFEDLADDSVEVQFGGSMPALSKESVHLAIAELAFNVVRWELHVRPSMLTWAA